MLYVASVVGEVGGEGVTGEAAMDEATVEGGALSWDESGIAGESFSCGLNCGCCASIGVSGAASELLPVVLREGVKRDDSEASESWL